VFCGFGGEDRMSTGIGTLAQGDIFLGGADNDQVDQNYGTFYGQEGVDFVFDNYGTFDGGADNDRVDQNYGTFDGGSGTEDRVTVNYDGCFINVELVFGGVGSSC
jgi:hypothetical protein